MGGSRSHFTGNKTALSQFTENEIAISKILKITIYKELNVYFSFHRELFWKITSHGY